MSNSASRRRRRHVSDLVTPPANLTLVNGLSGSTIVFLDHRNNVEISSGAIDVWDDTRGPTFGIDVTGIGTTRPQYDGGVSGDGNDDILQSALSPILSTVGPITIAVIAEFLQQVSFIGTAASIMNAANTEAISIGTFDNAPGEIAGQANGSQFGATGVPTGVNIRIAYYSKLATDDWKPAVLNTIGISSTYGTNIAADKKLTICGEPGLKYFLGRIFAVLVMGFRPTPGDNTLLGNYAVAEHNAVLIP